MKTSLCAGKLQEECLIISSFATKNTFEEEKEEEINGLIIDGIQQSGRDVSYEIIPKEIEALKHAMSMAEEGTFITALSDVISNAIDLVQGISGERIA